MTRDTGRGLSTVLDVAVCVLLVAAAVAALTTVAPDAPASDTHPSATARAALDSTATVTVENRSVRGTLAALLADAAVANATDAAPGYASAVTRVADRRLRATSRRAAVTATWAPPDCPRVSLAAGATPSPGAPIDAVTLAVPAENTTRCGGAPVHLTVRTWSR
ncbi:MAG: hypothetical protein ABEJ80_00020 [Halarchaeum sp.]